MDKTLDKGESEKTDYQVQPQLWTAGQVGASDAIPTHPSHIYKSRMYNPS